MGVRKEPDAAPAMDNVVYINDWRGRALVAERDMKKAKDALNVVRSHAHKFEKRVTELEAFLRKIIEHGEVYVGEGRYDLNVPLLSHGEIIQEAGRLLVNQD